MRLLAAIAAVLAAAPAVAQTPNLRITNAYGDIPTVCQSWTIKWEGNTMPVNIYGPMVSSNLNELYYKLADNVPGNSWTWDKFRLPSYTNFRISISQGNQHNGQYASGLGYVAPYYRWGTEECVKDPGAPPPLPTYPRPSSTCPTAPECPPCPSCSPCSIQCPSAPQCPPCPSCSPCSTLNPTAPPTTCTTPAKTKTKTKKHD